MNRWKDTLGIIASVTCAIHCAATPILLAFLPALKFTEWMASPQFHQVAAVVCVGLVAISIWPTFRKFKDYRVLSLSSTGLALVFAAAFVLPDECCSHSSVASHDHTGHDHTGHDHTEHDHDHVGHDHASHAGHDHSSQETNDELALASFAIDPEVLKTVQPWMTPLGGLLLVIAHALNLRRQMSPCSKKNCKCRSESNADSDESSVRHVVVLSTPKAA